MVWGPGLAAKVSSGLKTLVFQHMGEGVYYGFDHHLLFDKGREVNDPRESDQVAKELGLFVAYGVWGEDEGHVACFKDWDLGDFRAANLLLTKAR